MKRIIVFGFEPAYRRQAKIFEIQSKIKAKMPKKANVDK